MSDRETILAASDEVKARVLDHIVGHLSGSASTDPRPRERTRASIALSNICKWVKTKADECEPKPKSDQ